ncbi:MAG: response regulator [Alphaproteobacteria bacterium]|nr:response regulator [Alphaproteobacteria bacterium]MBF0250290.1 response regulator [Alphaproteobacteria bacterium]
MDDNAAVRALYQEVLESAGYEVVVAPNGLEGMALLERQPFDLVITDIFMPEMDGYEILRRMNEGDYGIPIIMMSSGGLMAHLLDGMLSAVKALGASEVLEKPMDAREILPVVAKHLPPR